VNPFAGAVKLQANYREFFMLNLYGIRDPFVLPLSYVYSVHTRIQTPKLVY
jgi:hypothetical protein